MTDCLIHWKLVWVGLRQYSMKRHYSISEISGTWNLKENWSRSKIGGGEVRSDRATVSWRLEGGGGGGGGVSAETSFMRGGRRRHHRLVMSRQFRQKMNCTTPQANPILSLTSSRTNVHGEQPPLLNSSDKDNDMGASGTVIAGNFQPLSLSQSSCCEGCSLTVIAI